MKFKTLLLCLALTAALLTGCQGNQSSSEESAPQQAPTETAPKPKPAETTPEPDSSEQAPAEIAPEEPFPTGDTVFQAGTWLGTAEDGTQQYYFFADDGASGQTASLESGMGLGFAYEYADGKAVFHMGGADDQSPCTVEVVNDSEHLTLQWEGRGAENLEYISSLGAEEFTFYSNDELCEMAITFYAEASGSSREDLTAGAAAEDDAMVTVQVYENLGDHNSTAAWYSVNRFTGQGTDVNTGEAVNLASAAQ